MFVKITIFFINIFIFGLSIQLFGAQSFTKEPIVFYSKKEDGSNERIARNGVLLKRPSALATVLILHGYGNNKFDVAPFRLFFNDYNCLTFDFRAHGEDIEDQYCTVGHDEVYDLFAAIDFIKSQDDLKNKPIFIWAPSMGASTAIEAQSLDPDLCQGMFLDAPFPSSNEILKKGLEDMKLGFLGYEFALPGSGLLERYGFHEYMQPVVKFLLKQIARVDATKIETFVKPILPIESIKKVTVPCYFVICDKDQTISVEGVTGIYKNHPGYKRLWITKGRGHCDSIFHDPEQYAQVAATFFNDVLTGQIYEQPKELIIKEKDIIKGD